MEWSNDNMILDDKIRDDIMQRHKKLQTEGKLLSDSQLDGCYKRFRQRFGIEQLQRLDGQVLLETMHAHGNQDSLVYWLEFKNDEELPGGFGSIAGGSAFKFGVFRRVNTEVWVTGSPQQPRDISLDEAIAIARKHRDQLAVGVDIISKLPDDASDEHYIKLQEDMDNLVPDVSCLAWGHKYFSMMFPDKLDDYHNPAYQRFHLVKMLQMPQGSGRYAAAGQYVRIASELGIRLNHLTSILNSRDGEPHGYWRIGTGEEKNPLMRWNIMRERGCVALGWESIGELPISLPNAELKVLVVNLLNEHYPKLSPQVQGRNAQYFLNLIGAKEGDIVMACNGATVLGIARITGPYYYQAEGNDDAHRRPVEWLDLGEWKMPREEQLRSSFRPLGKFPENLIEAERRILHASPVVIKPPIATTPRLEGILGRVQQILDRKIQVILYGPPGTGKTYWAEIAAMDLASYAAFGKPFAQLGPDQRRQVIGGEDSDSPLVRLCTFHPAYGYEDFLEGYRPCDNDGQLSFVLRDGLFLNLCKDAEANHSRKFFLIIDEINRGDIPRIFGELLTVLESSKRDKPVLLPLSGRQFSIPKNVFVIGTMNTADRSIALLDTALRRRFGFVELMPDSSVLGTAAVAGIPLGLWLDALNSRIIQHVGHDARNLQIGHSYLMEGDQPIRTFEKFARVVQDDLLPLLEEYCYEDYNALVLILGKGLVDGEKQRFKTELFKADQQDTLVQALLEKCPEITTSPQAIIAEETQMDPEKLDDEPNDDNETEA